MRRCVIVIALLLCTADAGAQPRLEDLIMGQRVRVMTSDGQARIGLFVAARNDSVTISQKLDFRLDIPLVYVRRVDLALPPDRGSAAVVGGLLGLAAGVGIGLLSVDNSEGTGANLAPLSGLVFGPPVGAVLGAMFAPERWRAVTLSRGQVSVRLAPGISRMTSAP